jgi:thiamine pyrophosphate-dependent acetolactate synthase large subunit-like protein
MAADSESTLPLLIEEVKRALPSGRKTAIERRGEVLRAQWKKLSEAGLAEAKQNWNASPISTGRAQLELLEQIKELDWSLVGGSRHMVKWARRLWPFQRHHQFIGLSGGDGRGYELPSAIGAALANRGTGRFSVNLQSDGAMMYTPQAVWTATHHQIPLLTVMMNNRAYQTEVEHVAKVSKWRGRKPNLGPDTGPVGTMLENPIIDYAKLAQSMGMYAIGPIVDPKELAPAYAKAIEVVKSGEPALVDVITQAR